MNIMVDMDDVITGNIFFDLICDFLGEKIDINNVKTYYLQELLGDRAPEFWESVKDKNFYEGDEIYEHCYEVMEKLNKKHNVYIVTSYLWKDVIDISGNSLSNKYYYLKEKLPFIAPEKYVFTTDKSILHFDVRIDDRVSNLTDGKIKLLYDAWHNRNISDEELKKMGIIRVYNWYDIEKVLDSIL